MKTSILKLICGVFSVGILFSSCLGDSDTNSSIGFDYAYITSVDGVKVAAVANGRTYITTDQIQVKGQEGQVYAMGYTINTSQTGGGGKYYIAEDSGQAMMLLTQRSAGIASPAAVEDDYTPTAFGVATYYADSGFFGDRWVFAAQAALKDKDEAWMEFYYDVDNQKEEVNGVAQEIGNNKIIIDIRFKKDARGDGALSSTTINSVGNLSNIRNYFRTSNKFSFNGEKYVYIPIKFRYHILKKDSNNQDVVTEVLEGNWNTDSSYKYLLYYEAQ
ncbi:hypothetical protein D0T84_02770 [Dysgonomonas sp. 521]|uniref:hypothetical protein n=1 Tax=Dysgonomonas sp. 521 TaxID=2302932 RepID=UPI0013D1379F|nr:hypothetical protein [Dysgonomonas sp. 521]NDV93841.1 hypothetical protein [Dysgonomonas sp. 521]